jgi:4-diphosphocytidyl-2-C-methyl-D-erythritol kinase
MLEKQAPAKTNLVLEVLGRREDGYHEIKSIMQTANICDRISFERDASLSLNTNLPQIPNEDNLIHRAALLLKNYTGFKKGARITLEKRIPDGAGFGGGSSDAATTLISLNELWELKLSVSDLLELAAKLGSDVPFFIYGGTALVEGRGEKVTPLKCLHKLWYVIYVPHIKIDDKTRKMYSLLTVENFTAGEHSNAILETLKTDKRVQVSMFYNVFDGVGLKAFPEIGLCWNIFVSAGVEFPHLSGSGPSIFGAFPTQAEAKRAYANIRKSGVKAFLAETFS